MIYGFNVLDLTLLGFAALAASLAAYNVPVPLPVKLIILVVLFLGLLLLEGYLLTTLFP